MSEEHRDEPFLRTVAAVQAQMSLINAEADELTDLGDMQAQRKLKADLNEYVSAHSVSGIIPSNPLEVIGDRLKALSEFFSDTNTLQLELLNIGKNILSAKEFSAHHAEKVKAPKVSSDYLKNVLVELSAANESLPSKLELLKLRLDPLDWVDNYPGTKLHPELPLCASASQIAIPVDVDERANLHALVHGAGSMHDNVKGHLEQIEKKIRELIKTHELYRKTLAVIVGHTQQGDYIQAAEQLDTIKIPFADLPFTECKLEVDKLKKSCEGIIRFCNNLSKACNDALDDYRTTEEWWILRFGKVAYQKAKDKLANLNKKLEGHEVILKSYRHSELENRCKSLLEKAHADLAKAEVKLVGLMSKRSRYRKLTWTTISVVVLAITLGIANQYNNHQLIEERRTATKNFILAIQHVSIEDVKRRLADGADVNAKDDDGWTPLFYAADEGHKEIAELFIAAGADVNAKTGRGFTPLYMAASGGHKEIVELLIAEGADVNAKSRLGQTPLDWADDEIAYLLRKHGAKTSAELNASQN